MTNTISSQQQNNTLVQFDNLEFGQIRTMVLEGKPYFVARDVATALGYKRSNDAIMQHCRCTVKRRIPHPQAPDKLLEVTLIPEGDIYRLIARSKLPSAIKFETWVFETVLPSIRKSGIYMTNNIAQTALDDPLTFLSHAVLVANKQIKALQATITQQLPKVQTYDEYIANGKTHSFTDAGKILGVTATDIIEYLRQKGILMRNIKKEVYPTKKYINSNYFHVSIKPKYIHTRLTAQGFIWLKDMLRIK